MKSKNIMILLLLIVISVSSTSCASKNTKEVAGESNAVQTTAKPISEPKADVNKATTPSNTVKTAPVSEPTAEKAPAVVEKAPVKETPVVKVPVKETTTVKAPVKETVTRMADGTVYKRLEGKTNIDGKPSVVDKTSANNGIIDLAAVRAAGESELPEVNCFIDVYEKQIKAAIKAKKTKFTLEYYSLGESSLSLGREEAYNDTLQILHSINYNLPEYSTVSDYDFSVNVTSIEFEFVYGNTK